MADGEGRFDGVSGSLLNCRFCCCVRSGSLMVLRLQVIKDTPQGDGWNVVLD